MSPDYVNRALFALTIVVLVLGGVDALFDSRTDSAAIFAFALITLIPLGWRTVLRHPMVRIRRDHVPWLHDRAIEGEETAVAVVDRAIGAYRAGLTGTGPSTEPE